MTTPDQRIAASGLRDYVAKGGVLTPAGKKFLATGVVPGMENSSGPNVAAPAVLAYTLPPRTATARTSFAWSTVPPPKGGPLGRSGARVVHVQRANFVYQAAANTYCTSFGARGNLFWNTRTPPFGAWSNVRWTLEDRFNYVSYTPWSLKTYCPVVYTTCSWAASYRPDSSHLVAIGTAQSSAPISSIAGACG